MRKIPCLFQRDFSAGQNKPKLTDVVEPGCEWVLAGEGVATFKWDGTSCLVKDGRLFLRYNAKNSKTLPPAFLKADGPEEFTSKWLGWLPVTDAPSDRRHAEAWERHGRSLPDGTYELVGPKVQGNPHDLGQLQLVRHGALKLVGVIRSFVGLRAYLVDFKGEGVVFHHPGGAMAKIRRADFGFQWPLRGGGR